MEKEIYPTLISIAMCPQIPQITDSKIFFHQLTAGRKYELTNKEYHILTDPDDPQMFIFYQYLIYTIYRRKIPHTIYHYKYVNSMITQLENRAKKLEKKELEQKKEKQKTKKLEKKNNQSF